GAGTGGCRPPGATPRTGYGAGEHAEQGRYAPAPARGPTEDAGSAARRPAHRGDPLEANRARGSGDGSFRQPAGDRTSRIRRPGRDSRTETGRRSAGSAASDEAAGTPEDTRHPASAHD